MKRIQWIASALGVYFCVSVLAEQRPALPMRFYGTRPAVDTLVNGQGPFLFLIDTGAASPPARADAALVQKLGLRPYGRAESSDAGGAVVGIDRVRLDRIEVGTLRPTEVDALSRDYGGATYLPRIDGILGLEFFKDVLLVLDYPHGRVAFGGGALPAADGRTVLDYELIEGNPAIRITIGGIERNAILDTGNVRALDVPSSWVKAMRLASAPRAAGSSVSVSGQTPLREVALHAPLIVGMHRIERPVVTFSDDFAEANLGSSFLQDFVVTIDQRNRRVRLARPSR